MKNTIRTGLSLSLIFLASVQLLAQEQIKSPNFFLYNSSVEFLTSYTIADSFQIYVSVPDNYHGSDKGYPVVYVLDGDIAFGMMTSIARYLQVGNNIPELIVVGIGYGSSTKDAGNKRGRDYSPAKGGQAGLFLKFLNEELIPHIDSAYRTIPGDRTINGYSLGGTFALYTLFSKPDTFNRYIVGSPFLSAGNFAINDYEENASEILTELNARVFISVGSEESDQKYFKPVDDLVSKIQSREYSGLKLETKVFEGGTHLICPPEAMSYGLISVFAK